MALGSACTSNCTIWPDTAAPENPAVTDNQAITVGVKFRSDNTGYISGLRFYKGSSNTGTHIGSLWTSTGTLLARTTFTNESSSGWQQASFVTPVLISPNTTYVASYYSSLGYFAVNANYFTIGVDRLPLHALAEGVDGGNGVFIYGDNFPTQSLNSGNYWTDVLFSETEPPAPSIISIAVTPASQTISAGSTQQFSATGMYSNGGTQDVTAAAAWESSDTNVATINAAGLATAVNAGSATISATLSSVTGTATLIVPSMPLTITVPPLYTAVLNQPYSASMTASGGTTPYAWTISGGSLPAGLSLNNGTGVLSGTATAGGTFSFTVQVTDSSYSPQTTSRSMSLFVDTTGSVLVITSPSSPFSAYYAEILRAEGLSEFTASDIAAITPSVLASFDMVILADMTLTSGQATMFGDWVTAGGRLIAMRPDKKLADLLGLTELPSTLTNAYLLFNTSSGPGAGLVDQTIQYHGTADLYSLNGAESLATLYSTAAAATASPAVTLRSVGSNGGKAAAFAYDLARSVVYTRQGNPVWAGQERDGDSFNIIRSDDMFYGNAASDPQPDWIDLNKVAIPQADEQQRLLVNLITGMNSDKKPLPRFWYLPRGLAAAVVMSGDDHNGTGGTAGRFDAQQALGPAGCSVDNWECIRSTSYIYPENEMDNSEASAYVTEGFEIGTHISTNIGSNCANWTPSTLESFFSDQLSAWAAKYSGIPTPVSSRMHCVTWSDYATMPVVELGHGIRFDTNYYYWPPAWVDDRPGFFTGSGMPMRFTDLNGNLIDVYQATTQLTDESGQTYPDTIDLLLDRALGPEGYYGIFTVNAHTDAVETVVSDTVVSSARARGIPVVSARQMLTWLDGRNSSVVSGLSWNGSTLGFTLTSGAGSNGLTAMIPVQTGKEIETMTRTGSPVSFTMSVIKGVQYALFTAANGAYVTTLRNDTTAPSTTITGQPANPTNQANASFSFTSSEAGSIFECRMDNGGYGACASPAAYPGLASDATHTFMVRAIDLAGNADATPASYSWVIDATPPDTSITNKPTNPANSTNASFSFTSTEAGSTFECQIDGGGYASCTNPALYTDLASTATHTFDVRSTDLAGNTDLTPATYSWFVDTTMPDTAITGQPSNPTRQTTAAFSFSSNKPGTFECQMDNGGYASCTSPATYNSLASNATHTFQVRAIDLSGTTDDSPATYSWLIDNTAPDTSITVKPANPSNQTNANFTFTTTEAGSTFECQIDNAGYATCTSPATYSSLAAGQTHTFDVRSTDTAGNTDATPATYSWVIDTAAPDTSITVKPTNPSNQTSAGFSFTSTEAGSTFACQMDNGGYSTCTSPATYLSLVAGQTHTFDVRATDAAGNTDATPATYSWLIDTAAPDTSITVKPANPTNETNASFSFTATKTGSTFECQIDNTGYATCTSPATYTSLAAGQTHTFDVRSTDTAGNADPTPATYSWVIDTAAPDTSITVKPTNPSNQTSAGFSFTSTEAGSTFACQMDNGGYSTCTSPATYLSLVAGQTHTFDVRATDAAGNTDAAPATYSWVIDTTAPDTSITVKPTNPTNQTNFSFSFTATEAGSTFECQMDNGGYGICTSPAVYSLASNGTHTFDVRSTDTAGNTDLSPASYSWVIDTTAPDTSITVKPADPTNQQSASFTFTATEAGSTFECQMDNGGYSSCTSPKTYSSLAVGQTHTFDVRATDAAGNTDASSAAYSWLIDTTAPDTSITGQPVNPTNQQSASFTFSSTEAGSTFECQMDGAGYSSCTSPAVYNLASNATHTFNVRAIDPAGNTDPSPAAYSWLIDSTAPNTSITSQPANPTNQQGASFTFSSTEAGSTFECRIDNGTYGSCTSPKTYSSLSAGQTHTFDVRATDTAGNTDATPATSIWVIDTTAPNTSITSQPANPTNQTGASFTFSSSEAGSTFECQMDGAGYSSCTGPKTYSGLGSGMTHTFDVRATDAAGNTDGTSATYSWLIDTSALGMTISTTAPDPTRISPIPIDVAFSKSVADFTAADVSITNGSMSVGSFTGNNKSYSFTVIPSLNSLVSVSIAADAAHDSAGNGNGAGSLSITYDSTAPDTSISSQPVNPTNQQGASFTFTSTEAGSTFECQMDAAGYSSCTSPKTYSSLTTGQTHTFSVRAIDAAGNTDASPASYSWVIDTTAPNTSITGQPVNPSNQQSASFTFSSSEAGSTFECQMDAAGYSSCTSPKTYSSLSAGQTHTFSVRSTDTAGNIDDTPASYSWLIDTAAPDTSITGKPLNPTNQTGASFTFSVTKAGSTFECRIDGGGYSACSSPATYSSLAAGQTHTFDVRATDTAGNTDPTPATYSWMIDTTAPDTSITDEPVNPTDQTSASFSFSANEAGSTFECRIDGGAYTACTSPATYSSLAGNQTHTFDVRATDTAGNTDPTSAAYSWMIDTTAPNAPAVSGATPTNNTVPLWTWASGGGGNGTYRFKLNSADLSSGATTTTGTSYAPATALPEGSHVLYVQEWDNAGNWSSAGSFAITIDITAPAVVISAPSVSTADNSTAVIYTITYIGADTVTLRTEDVAVNATDSASGIVTVSGSGNVTRTVSVAQITGYKGTLGITIAANTASDSAGNVAPAAGPSQTFVVDNSTGDFDGNGVDVSDALKALSIVSGLQSPSASDLAHGDVAPLKNGIPSPDGKINLDDVVVILRKSIGLLNW